MTGNTRKKSVVTLTSRGQQAQFGAINEQHDQNRNNIDSFNLLGGFILKAVVKTGRLHQGLYGIRGLTGPTEPFNWIIPKFWEQN